MGSNHGLLYDTKRREKRDQIRPVLTSLNSLSCQWKGELKGDRIRHSWVLCAQNEVLQSQEKAKHNLWQCNFCLVPPHVLSQRIRQRTWVECVIRGRSFIGSCLQIDLQVHVPDSCFRCSFVCVIILVFPVTAFDEINERCFWDSYPMILITWCAPGLLSWRLLPQSIFHSITKSRGIFSQVASRYKTWKAL